MIDRRTTLASVLAVFASPVFAPLARAAGLAGPGAMPPKVVDGPPSRQIFTPAQKALMIALSERIMPTTDTPGAIAAGVPAYIEKLLTDWAVPDERDDILRGLDAIDKQSIVYYKVPGAKATPEQQDELLTAAMDGNVVGGDDFFEKFRQLVIAGYYTSEIGMTQEREYLPVPGEYNGEFLYTKVNKVYSA